MFREIPKQLTKPILPVIIVVLQCFVCQTYASSEDITHLVIWHKDGSNIILNLAEKPKLSYVDDNVLIESSMVVECPFAAIKKMSYVDDETITGLEHTTITAETDKPFIYDGHSITFSPVDNDMHVKIFLLSGIVFKDFVVVQGHTSTLPLEALTAPIYLLSVNGITYKIKVK